MQPILDIRTVNAHLYTYSLGAAAQAEAHTGDVFDTAERCLQDAGRGLYLYFDRVQIHFAGFALGSYPVARMVNDPLGLFQELMARVMRIYRARAVPRWRPPQAVARERLSRA
ncbi:hypothetical protein [Variovorax sp. KK3]|uniref:hypothetical protein n=1 Tax=Variovorax sp. KK3 TaxID=1855728 RepID=UPI00097CB38A|nr:hypothetical protein [Variovorax sp. KK3]